MPQDFLDLKEENKETLSDRLLKASANATSALLTIAPLDDAVNTAIKMIGEALETDRVSVIENFDCPEQPLPCWKMLYEWNSPGTVSQISHPEVSQGTFEGIESWYKSFTQGQSISYLIEEMVEPFRSGQKKLGVKALYGVPIFVENKCWGLVGFDDCREVKHRDQSELSVLKIAANSIGSAIQRDRTQKALLQSEQARITELTKANAELIQRDHLLETTTVVANTLLTSAPFEAAIKTALKIIGEALDADRINVIENFDHPLDSSFPYWRALEYEWYSSNTVSQFLDPDNTQGSYGDIPSLLELFAQGKSISYVIEDMPEPFRSKQIAIGVKSTHIVPIFVEGKWWGVLGLDDCGEVKHRSAVELSLLKIAANCIGSAIQRDRTQKALLCSEQERANELESANKALRNAIAGMARLENLENFLVEMLKVSLEISGAHSGAVVLIEGDFLRYPVLFDNKGLVDPQIQRSRGLDVSELSPKLMDLALSILKSPTAWVVDPKDSRMPPEFIAFHQEYNNRSIRHIPMQISDRLIGWLGLGFAEEDPPMGKSFGLLKVLAEQMTLAVEMLRLSNEAQQTAIARERERAAETRFTELTQANQAIQRVLALTAKNTSLDLLLGNVLQAIAEQFDTPLVEWWETLDEGTVAKRLSYLNGQMFSGEEIKGHHGVPSFTIVPDTLHMEPMTNRQKYVLVEDVEQLPYASEEIAKIRDWYVKNGTQKFLNVPVITDERSIGGLLIFFPTHRHFSESQIEFSFAMARLVGLAIVVSRQAEVEKQTAIAYEQEQAAAARVLQLVKANAVLKQTLDVLATEPEIESSLGHVLKVSSEQLDSPSSALWLYNSSTEKFYLHLVYMDNQIIPVTAQNIDLLTGKWLRGRKLTSDLFLKRHIRERSPVIYQVDDTSVVPPPLRKSLETMGVKTLLGIPLLLGSEIIGSFTLRFTEKRQFQAEELELTQALANQATLAIQLLRMAEEAKQAAIYEERNRLAGEIHDTLAQAFTGISLQLGVVKWLLQEGSLALEPILDRINDIAQTGLAEARRSVWEIYPTAQEYSNLAEKLSQAVEKLTRDCPLQVDLKILGSEYQVSAIIGYNLIKLAQEAITNALKHAKATKLSIILTYREALLSLRISDNGCGFQPNLDNGGFGLLSISERSDRIGGQLLINSILGKGTEILVEIPLEEQKS